MSSGKCYITETGIMLIYINNSTVKMSPNPSTHAKVCSRLEMLT
jgi:hypothetical protein